MRCRPALNYYLLASWPGEYEDDGQSRFINERVHANIQKDGTYSVVPRMWGGVTSAAELRAIADVVDKFAIPTVKVTGGQRIDLFGVPRRGRGDFKQALVEERRGRVRDRRDLGEGRLHEIDIFGHHGVEFLFDGWTETRGEHPDKQGRAPSPPTRSRLRRAFQGRREAARLGPPRRWSAASRLFTRETTLRRSKRRASDRTPGNQRLGRLSTMAAPDCEAAADDILGARRRNGAQGRASCWSLQAATSTPAAYPTSAGSNTAPSQKRSGPMGI